MMDDEMAGVMLEFSLVFCNLVLSDSTLTLFENPALWGYIFLIA